MILVLRDDSRDEVEPTHRATCIEDLSILPIDEIIELESRLYISESSIFDVLIHQDSNLEVYLRVYSSECVEVLELRVRGCKDKSKIILEALTWPEVSRALVEGECVELQVPAHPPVRVKEALRKLGLTKISVQAYRSSHTA